MYRSTRHTLCLRKRSWYCRVNRRFNCLRQDREVDQHTQDWPDSPGKRSSQFRDRNLFDNVYYDHLGHHCLVSLEILVVQSRANSSRAAYIRKKHPDWINVPTLIVDCVSVAIAFIPEGLPIALTASLTITAN